MTRRVLLDAFGALALAAFCVLVAGATSHVQADARPVDASGYALIGVACLALLVRAVWPAVTLAVAAVAVSVYLTIGYPYGPVLLAVALAVYTVVVRWPLRRAAVASGATLVVLLVHLLTWSSGSALPALFAVVPASAWIAVPFAVGMAVRFGKESRQRERAAAADDERLRVAQEVHDVVGHGLAAITLQAEIALHLMPTKPEQAEKALTAISATSREALDELRATLAEVRNGAVADRVPPAGLARLSALTERITASGTPVTTSVTGAPYALPPAVDLAAYRVVQESLTNVLRHAGPATARVVVCYAPELLRVEVSDTGGLAVEAVDGHGIAGMRERVSALGGTFAAGAAAEGFRVAAAFPVPAP